MIIELVNKNAFLIASILMCGLMIGYTVAIHRTDRSRNRVFMLLMIITMLSAMCEMGKSAVRLASLGTTVSMVVLDGLEYLHSVFHLLIPLFFCFYVILVNGSHRHMDPGKRVIFFMPCVLMELLILTNPFHQLVYTHDRALVFHGGVGMTASYAVALGYAFLAFFNLIRHRRALAGRRLTTILCFLPVSALGIAAQLLDPAIKSELFSVSLLLLGVMLTLENEDERMDAATGVYNRTTLKQYLDNLFRLGQHYHVIAVRITNYDILMRLSGGRGVDAVMQCVADYLKKECPWYRIFRATATDFMILTDLSYEEVVRLSEMIYVRFMDGLYIEDCDKAIAVMILRAAVPEELAAPENVMLMVDTPIPEKEEKGIICGKRLAYLTRSADLGGALERGLRNGGFSLVFQPVHMHADLEPCGMKVLLRLNDPELGALMPGEFIPQAERTGMIQAIGELVLEESCRFLQSGVPEKLGYPMMSMNLSLVQCLQPDFAERVCAIMDKYKVAPHRLIFELRRPTSPEDHEVLSRVMKVLMERGVHFSLEDFGAGYANVEAILELGFDVVKINRNILWEAMESEMGRIVLQNSIRMIQELKCAILVEGVESREQVRMLSEMAVDFMQGYYFSKPVTKEELEKLAAEGKMIPGTEHLARPESGNGN